MQNSYWKIAPFFFWFFFSVAFAVPAMAAIDHTSPELVYPQVAQFKIRSSTPATAVRFFFKSPQVDVYQMRFMTLGEDGSYSYDLETKSLTDLQLDYYFEVITPDGIVSYPANAPLKTISLNVKDADDEILVAARPQAVLPQKKSIVTVLPLEIAINGSFGYEIDRGHNGQMSNIYQRRFLSDGNVRIFKSYQDDDLSVEFNANFASSNTNSPISEDVWLSHLLLKAQLANHRLQLGDLSLAGSYLTGDYLNRRGASYSYKHPRISGEVFWVSNRPDLNWNSIAPRGDNYVYGGNINLAVFPSLFHLDLHYRNGRDDPAAGSRSSSLNYQVSEGDLATVAPRLFLFDNALTLFGEYGFSHYDADVDTGSGKQRGDAWRVGLQGTYRNWLLKAHYRNIEPEFNTVTNYNDLYYSVDRRGPDVSLEYRSRKFSALVGWEQLRDNLDDDVNKDWSHYQTLRAKSTYQLARPFTLMAGFRQIQEESYDDEAEAVKLKDVVTNEYNLGFNYNLYRYGMLRMNGMYSTTRCDIDVANELDAVSANLSYSYRKPGRFQFYPSVSYSRNEMKQSGERTSTINYYLNMEYFFIPSLLSISTTDSFSRTTGDTSATTSNLAVTGWLNLHLGDRMSAFDKFVLALGGDYRNSKISGDLDEAYSISLRCNFSM